MATPTHNYEWPQGEDLEVSFLYKVGPVGSEVPVDLTGYTVRMDIVHPTSGNVIFTFNTADQADPDEVTVNNPDTGYVLVVVPRSITLPDGELYSYISGPTPLLSFNYDIFLRSPADKQKKLFRGTITIEPSYTLWE